MMRPTRLVRTAARLAAALLVAAASLAHAEDAPRPELRVELDREVAVPGQSIALEITLLVPTWMPEPPVFPSFELPNLMVRLPEGASGPTQQPVGDETWPGVKRIYRLYPMALGEYRLPRQRIVVTWADPPNPPRVTELWIDEIVFSGRAPAGAEDLVPFVAAESLTLAEEIEGEPDALEPGDAFTRTVTATLTGASPAFLPPLLSPVEVPGLAVYPAEPVLREVDDGLAFAGERIERVTWVAEAGARTSAAPVRVRWWNLAEERVETAELPGFEIVATGPPPSAGSTQEPARELPWIALTLGALAAILVLALLRRGWPRIQEAIARAEAAWRASETWAYRQVRAGLRRRSLDDTLRALDRWRTRAKADAEPEYNSLEQALDQALAALGAARYGTAEPARNDDGWRHAERTFRRLRAGALEAERRRRRAAALPALNPRAR